MRRSNALTSAWSVGLAVAFAAVAFAAAEAGAGEGAFVNYAGSGIADCVNVREVTPPAIPNDGLDDRAAIQKAIETAISGGLRAVCLPGGTYDVARGSSGSASFDLGNVLGAPATDLAIIGSGPGTVLEMSGDGTGTSWYLFAVGGGAARIGFRDLTLDGSGVTNPGTNTRLLQIGTDALGASEIDIGGVILRGSPREAIRIQGSTTPTVRAISIHDSRILSNGSRGVVLLGGAEQIQITGNYFSTNTEEDLRVDPAVAPAPTDLAIANNLIVRSATSVPTAIMLNGTDGAPGRQVVLANNILLNGRIWVKNFDRVNITGNLVAGGPQAGIPELKIERQVESLLVEGNQLIRSSATADAVLSLSHLNGVAPRRAVIRNNILLQSGVANVAQLWSVGDASFLGNYVGFSAASSGVACGIQLRAISNPIQHVVIAGNSFDGSLGGGSFDAGVRLSPSSYAIGNVIVTGNDVRGSALGVRFDAGVPFTAIPMIDDNLFEVTSGDVSGFSSSLPAIAVGGNIGGALLLSGTGSPEGVVAGPVGSLFFRRDAAPSLYVKQTGIGAAGWVAK